MIDRLPKSWDDISYSQFVELQDLLTSNNSIYNFYIDAICIFLDIDPEDDYILDMDVEVIGDIIQKMYWLKLSPTDKYKQVIGEYTFKPLVKLTLGEFIDLEYYFSGDVYNNLPKICAICYRKTKQDEWGNLTFEPYNNINLDIRSQDFLSLKITDIFGVIKEYLDYKTNFHKSFELLFEPVFEEEEDKNKISDFDEQQAILEEKKQKKWSWENMLYNLSGGDILKYDSLTDLPLIFVFNHLSYKKDMNI